MQDIVWSQKYRPHTIDDIILPSATKRVLKDFVSSSEVPNLILSGSQGIGKTTVALTLLEEISADFIKINGSLNGGIDTLRDQITDFASSVSLMSSGRKFVILDEGDNLTQACQLAMRSFIEDFSKSCGFILTCNFPRKILDSLHSRFSVVDFHISNEEKPKLAKDFMKRLVYILEQENIEYDQKILIKIILKYFPDWRRIINFIQSYSVNGKIDSGILANLSRTPVNELISHMKEKSLSKVMTWLIENQNIGVDDFFREFYDNSYNLFKPNFIPLLVILIGKYQYQAAFVADQQINLCAFIVEVIADAEWKD